jgi:hypothetical protein
MFISKTKRSFYAKGIIFHCLEKEEIKEKKNFELTD